VRTPITTFFFQPFICVSLIKKWSCVVLPLPAAFTEQHACSRPSGLESETLALSVCEAKWFKALAHFVVCQVRDDLKARVQIPTDLLAIT
jgi:hypothetical protein